MDNRNLKAGFRLATQRYLPLLCVYWVSCISINHIDAADFPVSSAADIQSILSSVGPGDTITMQDGNWTNQQINFSPSANGTSSQPITLRAETPGQVILNGTSTLNIGGDWLVADGLNFDGGALASGGIIEFRGSNGDANNSRLTNSAITNYNPADINTRYHWVRLYGTNNRVDHNSFSGQNHSGVTLTVERDGPTADNHLIDNNYFANRPEGNGNGFETIRIGDSSESLSSSFTTVENNLFEATDGEAEIISNKSGHNTFQYNTFREAAGTLTLRHGDNNTVEGNFFLGNGKNETGGVRVIGENQTVVNNYFHNTDGRAGGAISFAAGLPNSPVNGYYQVKNAVVAHNTIVGLADRAAIIFDDGLGGTNNGGVRTLLPEDVTIANNLISSTADPLFDGNEGSNWTWEGNIAFGQSLGPKAGDPGITVVDPQLSFDGNGTLRPGSNSPAVNGGSGNYSNLISVDMDGQPRIGVFDVGADEFSTAAIVRKPLESGDVGYDWNNITNPPDPTNPSCLTDGIAVQSDDYSSLLDPNGDGDSWTVQASSDALGGTTLVAPNGSRVVLPGTHDAIVSYDVEFSAAGTYTAYYRARGFSGSTDSLYTPDDFDINPDVNQSLSNNGIYEWEAGDTFQISSSEVGVPLEFRIGMREQDAEFDAFVLHLDSSLSSTELDSLFSLDCTVDFNSDGSIDCGDINLLVNEIVNGTNDLAFDLDGDGLVNSTDLTQWLSHAGEINLASGGSYLPGDANLDGTVDDLDFDVWNANRFTESPAWCLGDFNADGFVDVSDLNIWNTNKGQSALAAAVPEPSGILALLVGGLLIMPKRRTSR